MKLLLCLLLTGCAQTTITTPYLTIKTQANIRGMVANGDSFRFDDLNQSTPTLAGGKAFGGATTAVGTAATGLATGLLAHGL